MCPQNLLCLFVNTLSQIKPDQPTLIYNLGHNILEVYYVLVQVQFATSKTKLDIQYNKLGIPVASRADELRKTQEIRKHKKMLKSRWRYSIVPSLNPKNLILAIAIKQYRKADIKAFQSCPILLDFFTLFQIFCPGLYDCILKNISLERCRNSFFLAIEFFMTREHSFILD